MTLSLISSSSSSSNTINVPSGVQAGDLLVLSDYSGADVAPSLVIPSGFSSLVAVDDGLVTTRMVISFKLAAGSEGDTVLTGMSVGDVTEKRLAVFRSDPSIASINAAVSGGGNITGFLPSPATAQSSLGTPPILVIGSYGSTGNVNPRGMNPSKDGEIGSGRCWLAWKYFEEDLVDVTISMNDHGNINALAIGYLQLTLNPPRQGFSGIYDGETQINAIKYGSDDIVAAYIGADKIFEAA